MFPFPSPGFDAAGAGVVPFSAVGGVGGSAFWGGAGGAGVVLLRAVGGVGGSAFFGGLSEAVSLPLPFGGSAFVGGEGGAVLLSEGEGCPGIAFAPPSPFPLPALVWLLGTVVLLITMTLPPLNAGGSPVLVAPALCVSVTVLNTVEAAKVFVSVTALPDTVEVMVVTAPGWTSSMMMISTEPPAPPAPP